MTHIDTDLVVLARTVTISQESNLSGIWNDTLNFDTNLVFCPLFFLVAESVVYHFVVKFCWLVGGAARSQSESLRSH